MPPIVYQGRSPASTAHELGIVKHEAYLFGGMNTLFRPTRRVHIITRASRFIDLAKGSSCLIFPSYRLFWSSSSKEIYEVDNLYYKFVIRDFLKRAVRRRKELSMGR